MPELTALSCPSCGFELQLTGDTDRIVCPACRSEYRMDHSGNEFSLHPASTRLNIVDQAHDAQDIKKAIASTRRSITHLNKKIKETRSGTGLFDIILGFGLGGLSIVVGLVGISNFIRIADKAEYDIQNMFLCGIAPLIGGAFFVFLWFAVRDRDKAKLREMKSQLAQKQQELKEHQNKLSASSQSNPDRNEPT